MAQLNDLRLQKVYVWTYFTLPMHMFDSFVITSRTPCAVIADPSLGNPAVDDDKLDKLERKQKIEILPELTKM